MKKILSLFFALLAVSVMNAKVAFLVPAADTNEISMQYEEVDGAEQSPERRAWRWFNTNFVTPGNGQFICFNDLSNIPSDVNAIWIYVDRVGLDKAGFDNLFTEARKAQLQAFLNNGGNLFLCKQATRLEMTLVGARNGQSWDPGTGDVIEPDYNWGGYRDAATWGVDFKFFSEEGWGSNLGHRMFAGTRHHNSSYAELIWTNGGKLTDNNCGIGTGAMGMNDQFDRDKMAAFQARNNCKVLGAWANDGDGCNNVENDGCFNGCHYGGVIEFYPTGNRKGTVITFGLAAYSWINNNGGWGFENTEDITRGALEYLNARPQSNGDNPVSMETKLAEDYFFPSNTTTFRTLHPVCEDMAATYSITSDPNGIARIHEGKLQFKAAGAVTLHVVLTENREFKAWPKGTYEYDREITFAYANANAAQDAVNQDFPGNGVTFEGEPATQMAMRLHPSVRGMDSLSYTITNHYDNTQGEAYKKTEDGVTRLYFSKSGKVLLTLNLRESNWNEAWPMGDKELTRVVEFNYTQEAGPTFPWPAIFSAENVPAKSVIELPETVEGLHVTYTIDGDATLNDYTLTLADQASGSVTVHASVTETGIKVTWPVGTYDYENTINFQKFRPRALDNTTSMETKLAEDYFFPSNTTTFRILHPVCEDMAATYSITSDPNGIARIHEGELQFKAAGTVTLHIVLTENRGDKLWEDGDYEYDREITFSYPYDSPRAFDNSAMADKLADAYFYPANTTTFRTLHPVCEGIGATYTLTDPNNIARIQENVQVGEATITQLQFQAAGTVTLHVTLTEEREYMYWPTGVYNYDREITFAYANANAAQDAVNQDFPGNGWTAEGEPATQMAMRLHPSVRGMDSLSYTITNHYDNTQGEAYKKTEDGVTRLYFSKSGKVLLTIRLNEPNWREEWTPGVKELERVIEFNFAQDAGPALTWPSVFETGAVDPNSVITLPETAEGLPVTYTVEGDASLDGNVLTLANVESGSVTVQASVTVSEYQATWPIGTYNYENTLSFHTSEVGYLLPAAESIDHMAGWYEGEQPEYNAAKWFQDNYIATGKGRFVTVEELPTLYAKGIKTLWVNIERIGIDNENGLLSTSTADEAPKCATRLETYIKAGGNVLLTKQATRLAYLMDRIGYAPEFNAGGYSTDDPGNARSIATCMGTGEGVDQALDMSEHRLYTDMLSYWAGKNIFLVAPACNKTNNYCSWQDFFTDDNGTHEYGNAYIQRLKDFENAWDATVFGIQGNIGDYCLSNIIEFNATGDWQGRILTIGSAAYQWGTSNNHVERENLTKLTANALAYLLDEPVEEEVYTRDIVENMFGTICWGYDVEAGKIAGAEIYELTSLNADGNGVILTEVNSMVGGRAYFFLGTSTQLRLTYTGQKKEAEVGGHNGLVGYIPLTGNDPLLIPQDAHNYILYNNKLLLVDSEINLPVHRAYVNMDAVPAYQSEAPAGVRRRVVTIDRHDMPTDVENVEIQLQQGTYDIMGRKLSAPQGVGFYIIDGQKVVITH